jgi:hypothetical protein
MRDVFYTILVVWILWRVMSSVNTMRSKNSHPQKPSPKQDNIKGNYSANSKKSFSDDEGEYVDFEEIK